MPTPEEIKKIATAYFTSKEAEGTYSEIERAFQWLSKNYCIVPKSQIKQWYDSAKKTADYFPNAPRVSPLNRAKATIEILGSLFGKSLFMEDEK